MDKADIMPFMTDEKELPATAGLFIDELTKENLLFMYGLYNVNLFINEKINTDTYSGKNQREVAFISYFINFASI